MDATPGGARRTTGSKVIAPSENNSLGAVVIAHIKNDFPVPAVPPKFTVKADQIEIRMSQWKIRLKMSQKDLKKGQKRLISVNLPHRLMYTALD